MTYPNGKAIHDAMISKSRYSLKNKFRIVPILAPLTLRIAISLRRCCNDKVIEEKDAEYGNCYTYKGNNTQ